MSRLSNAEIVHDALPEMGSSPVQVQRLAQSLPLTLGEVSAALQSLKHSGRAINPRGTRTNYWTKYIAPVVPEPEPAEDAPPSEEEPAPGDVDARVHEVERHLARIEGALAGMSSRLGEVQEELEASKYLTESVSHVLYALAKEFGIDPTHLHAEASGSMIRARRTGPTPVPVVVDLTDAV